MKSPLSPSSPYTPLPGFVLGFHGCDRRIGELVISGSENLNRSNNEYDWLGSGNYFWESNPSRALEYARLIKEQPERCKKRINDPFVVGAVIGLGYCLNLLEHDNLQILKTGYELVKSAAELSGTPLPENKSADGSPDLLLRKLDRAVIESLHAFNKDNGRKEYDSVRAVFVEGAPLYPGAGFCERNHMQICVRNQDCIKGYFRVRGKIRK